MKNKILKILGGLVVAILISQYNVAVFANEVTDLQNKQSDNEEKINEAKEQKEQVTQEKSDTQKQVDELNNQISSYESEIGDLDVKIENLNTQIQDAENTLNEKQENYDKQQKLLEERLVATYEAGETSYLDVLLSSDSITDLISNYYLVSEIANHDLELMDNIKKEQKEIEESKATLETSKQDLANSKAEKESKSQELQVARTEKSKYVSQLSAEEQDSQEEIDQLTKDNQQILNDIKIAQQKYQKQLEELKNKANSSNNSSSSGNASNGSSSSSGSTSSSGGSSSSSSNPGGFIVPINYNYISCNGYYSSGKFHGAIDYAASSGTPVYAAADGVVMTVKSMTTSYGTHVVIQHANGLQTWYAHGTPGSVTVTPGQIVSQGQVIMKSGNSGNSQGPHLHFEVRKSPYNYSYSATKYGDDSRVNPNAYF